jgi:pimeloyl-ACP methyl ester carboxylesterase
VSEQQVVAVDKRIQTNGLRLAIRAWAGDLRPILLLHGLSSNARTWEQVANRLATLGHRVVTVDQRGHGRSDKPARGYDFATVTADLHGLIAALGLAQPLIAGQSWGGNVVLAFAARYPGVAHSIAFVDGGFIDFRLRSDPSWEAVERELRPPEFTGSTRAWLAERIRQNHPDWREAGVEATLNNFETLADGTLRPWLSLDRHMQILRALWEQRPDALYPLVKEPVVLMAVAGGGTPQRAAAKRQEVAAAEQGLARVAVHWFENSDHDLHVQQPELVARLLSDAAR